MRTGENGPAPGPGGAAAAEEAPRYLGIDVGGTKVALRAESATGRAEETSFAWGPGRDADHDLARLAEHVGTLSARSGAPFRAVGVAMPATVGPDERVTAWPSRPEWTGLPLGPALRALFPGAAVVWADDGDLAALAEAQAAASADHHK
ncbi:ROK family protein, partial [Kitasatospora sp. NPDC058263]